MSESAYLAAAKEVGGEDRIGCALIALAESVAELVEVIKAQQVVTQTVHNFYRSVDLTGATDESTEPRP